MSPKIYIRVSLNSENMKYFKFDSINVPYSDLISTGKYTIF